MKQFLVQFFKDFKSHFLGFHAYIILGAYYVLSLFSAIYLGDYFLRESETMNSYFALQPVILILVIPAVTMKFWTEEVKSGTIELLLTQPISYFKLVMAKFLAAYAFFVIMVCFSLPFLFITSKLSVLDCGVVFFGYVGLFLCGALFTAAGVFISACCRSLIISYLATIFILFAVALSGFSFVGSVPLSGLNFEDNYNAFFSGILHLGNAFYFILGTVLLLWLNVVVVSYKKGSNQKQNISKRIFVCLLAGIFVFGVLGVYFIFDTSFDVTTDNRYALTEENDNFLKTMDKRIDVTLYEAKNKRENSNSSYAVYAGFTERLLKMMEKSSKGAFRVETVLVEPFSALERKILRDNTPFKEDEFENKIFMIAEFSDNDGNTGRINAFSSLRQNLLETDIMRVVRMFGSDKKNVALISSQNDLDEMLSFKGLLSEFYNVTELNFSVNFILPTYSAVIVINPTFLSTEFMLAMEQYVLSGGSLLLFYDPLLVKKNNGQLISNFLRPFGIIPLISNIPETQENNLGGATIVEKDRFRNIRSVVVNKTGGINFLPNKNYSVSPILEFADTPIGVVSEGKFPSNYLNLAMESSDIKAFSVKEGKVFFFFDSDLLKDYLYVSNESGGNGFYETIPMADNMLFFLRLMDFAVGGEVENHLVYRHYAVNVSSIGNAILNNIKIRYTNIINDLKQAIDLQTKKQNDIHLTLANQGYASVKNIGDLSEITQNIEELEDEISRIKNVISSDYRSVIGGITFGLIVVIPFVILLILALVNGFYQRYHSQKIRRIMHYAKSS